MTTQAQYIRPIVDVIRARELSAAEWCNGRADKPAKPAKPVRGFGRRRRVAFGKRS